MTRTFLTKSIASLALAGAAVTGLSGTAHAREHILLARQVGVPAMSPRNADADCWDWTNDDGTHGTNCPSGGGGGGGGLGGYTLENAWVTS